MSVVYDPRAPDVIEDPYPVYRALREREPVHYAPSVKGWMLTRYDDVRQALQDRRLSNDRMTPFMRRLPEDVRAGMASIGSILGRFLNFSDPPQHTRLRALINKAFTPAAVEAMRPRVVEIVEGVLRQASEKGEMEVIADLARPLPLGVIADMLGVPEADRETFRAFSHDLALLIGGALTVPNKLARAQESLNALVLYLRDLVAERRRRPTSDLTSALIVAEGEQGVLSEDELMAVLILLLGAGHETTTNLIGNGMLALVRHPGELERLRADPSLVASAVEEFARYDGANQNQGRIATCDYEVRGARIPEGALVHCMINAANRDPEAFEDPERLDIGRANNRHLSFGYGIHFCLGAPLARLEAQVAFGEIARRVVDPEIVGSAVAWRDSLTFRGLSALPIRFRAPRGA